MRKDKLAALGVTIVKNEGIPMFSHLNDGFLLPCLTPRICGRLFTYYCNGWLRTTINPLQKKCRLGVSHQFNHVVDLSAPGGSDVKQSNLPYMSQPTNVNDPTVIESMLKMLEHEGGWNEWLKACCKYGTSTNGIIEKDLMTGKWDSYDKGDGIKLCNCCKTINVVNHHYDRDITNVDFPMDRCGFCNADLDSRFICVEPLATPLGEQEPKIVDWYIAGRLQELMKVKISHFWSDLTGDDVTQRDKHDWSILSKYYRDVLKVVCLVPGTIMREDLDQITNCYPDLIDRKSVV